jgi:hypothetical protein
MGTNLFNPFKIRYAITDILRRARWQQHSRKKQPYTELEIRHGYQNQDLLTNV